jgi:hypothetical protein
MGGSPMISTAIFVAVAIFLVLFLLLIMRREEVEEQESVQADGSTQRECRDTLQHPGLAIRIFSREDREFILLMRSPRLQRIYQEERRKVALHWVRQTSREVSRIMRTHGLIARQSRNLDAGAEAKLFFQYLQLRFICGLLVLLIKTFGPHALHDLASYAGELSQLIGRALPDAAAANHVASSGNPGTP